MKSLPRASAFLAIAIAVTGCSSSSNAAAGDAGKVSGFDDGGSSSANVSGSIDGSSFSASSAVSHLNADGSVDLIFGDQPGLCASLNAGKYPAGGTLVQLFGLVKGASGNYAPAVDPSDIKVLVTDASCNAAYHANAGSSTPTVTLTQLDSKAVVGSLDITFDASSHVSGSFTAPACASTLTETDVCP